MKFKVGDIIVFTSYNDSNWSEDYAGKLATVKKVYDLKDIQELQVKFQDDRVLGIMSDECIHYGDEHDEHS